MCVHCDAVKFLDTHPEEVKEAVIHFLSNGGQIVEGSEDSAEMSFSRIQFTCLTLLLQVATATMDEWATKREEEEELAEQSRRGVGLN